MRTKNKNTKIMNFQEKIFCNGGDGDAGHPRIYLVISSKKGYVKCPYCGKQYKGSK